MNTRLRRNTFRCVCVGALTALLVACGNPGAERKTFVFTPVPYTVVARDQCPDTCPGAVFLDQDGEKYAADQLAVLVRADFEPQLQDFIELYGFTVFRRFEQELRDAILLYVEVPPGSVLAARALFSSEEGVVSVELNGYARIQ